MGVNCSCLKKKKIEFERHSIDYYGENWRRCTVTKKTTNKQILEQTESEYKFFVSIEKLNKSLMRNNDILDSKMQLNQEHGDTLNTWNNVMVMKMQKVVKLTKELLENENFANYSKTDAKNSLIKMKSCINLNDLQSINENRRLNNENIIINGNDKSAKDKCTTITTPKTIKYKPFKSNRSMRSNKSLKSNKSHKISISESSYSKNTEDDVIKKINRISEKIVKSFLTFRKLQIPKLNNIIQSKYSLDNINQIISKEIRICFLNIEQVKSDDYFTTYIYKKSTKAVMWDTTKFEYVRPEHVDNSYDNFVPKLAFKPNDHCESYYNWKNLNFDKHPYRLEYQNMNLNSIVDQYKNNYLFSSHQNKTYKFKPISGLNNLGLLCFQHSDSFDSETNQNPLNRKSMNSPNSRLCYVNDVNQIRELVNTLAKRSVIAIDLEHHNKHSYLGFTCLMQISDNSVDWIIDTVKLRNNLQPLNVIFTNEKIVKIFHGANQEILWLQKDFGLYIVNMFDTYYAAIALKMRYKSYQYILWRYCRVLTDKVYQTSDWRIRPLPKPMVTYARIDTHYLCRIYKRIVDDLFIIDNTGQLYLQVLNSSKSRSLRLYKKPKLNKYNYQKILNFSETKKKFSNSQITYAKNIYTLIDRLSRREDQSVYQFCPPFFMYKIFIKCPKSIQEFNNLVEKTDYNHLLNFSSLFIELISPINNNVYQNQITDIHNDI